LVPQANITIITSNGITLQAISRGTDPWMAFGAGSSELLRRYLTAKKKDSGEDESRHRDTDHQQEGVECVDFTGGR